MKKLVSVILTVMLTIAVSGIVFGCNDGQEPLDSGTNRYTGGETFDFGKWSGAENVYIIETNGSTETIHYNKISSAYANQSVMSFVSGDFSGFTYVNFTLRGTQNREVMIRLGAESFSVSLIGDARMFLEETAATYSFKIKNRLALAAVDYICLFAEPGVSGINAKGIVCVERAWFSNSVPDGAVIEEETSRFYKFALNRTWVKQNGWYLDIGWSNMDIKPAPEKGTRIQNSSGKIASDWASVVRPLDPKSTDTKFSFVFDNIGNSLETMVLVLRGAEKVKQGDYYDVEPYVWENTVEGNDTNEVTVEYDLAKAMAALGSNVDEDGYLLLIFFENHGWFNSQRTAGPPDKSFDVLLKSATLF